MKPAQNGFTMIEMVVVMSIVGILFAIGAPSYRYVTTSNRMASEVNGMLGDLQFARAEAIKRGQTVSVCASTNGVNCATNSTHWETGWLVITDTGVIGTIDGSDIILRVQKPFSGGDTFVADSTLSAVTFNRDGFAMGLPPAVVMKLHDSTANTAWARCLSITIVGALSTQISGATTAENTACN